MSSISSITLNQLVSGFSIATAQFQQGQPAGEILEGVRAFLPPPESEWTQALEPLQALSVANGCEETAVIEPQAVAHAFHESAVRLQQLTQNSYPTISLWAENVRQVWRQGISYPPAVDPQTLVNNLLASETVLIDWLKQFVEFAPQPMGVVKCHSDGAAEMVLFNRKNRERWGLDENGLAGVDVLRFFYPEDHDMVRGFIMECLQTGNSSRTGVRMLRRSGGHLMVDMYVGRVDETNYAYFQVIDETEREEAFTQVRVRDAVFRNAQKPLLMLSFDEDGIPTGMVTSAGFDRMMGYGPGEMGVRPVIDFIPRHLRAAFLGRIREFLETGSLNWQAVELVTKAGSMVLVDIEAKDSGVKGERYAIVTFGDAKARIDAERDAAEAQKAEVIANVSSAIAHDANNMLTIISGGIQFLGDDAQDKDFHRDMMNNVDMLVAMLNGFRQLTDTVKDEVDLHSLLKESMIRLIVPKMTGVTIQLDLADNSWLVGGPNFTVWQIVFNIIKNAMEAMQASSTKTLTLITENIEVLSEQILRRLDPDKRYPKARPGQYLKLSISDTGSGMSPEVLGRLFQDYFSTKDSSAVSRGRGLAASQSKIAQRGGFLSVRSEVGSGTTFDIYLPRANQITQAAGPTMTAASMLDPRWMSPGNEVVLIADDDETVRQQYGKILGHFGYKEILFAKTTQETLAIARERTDLTILVMDWRMPGETGDMLLGDLRNLRPKLPILVNTGLIPDHKALHPGVQFATKLKGATAVGRAVRRVIEGKPFDS